MSAFQRQVDGLAAELRARTSDHEEALPREASVAEILQVTNASGGDLRWYSRRYSIQSDELPAGIVSLRCLRVLTKPAK
jgi:hypothetical protein